MTATTTYPSAPMPVYNIHRNDFVNQDYQATIGNDGLGLGSQQSFCPLPLNGVQAPSFPYTLPFQQPNNRSYLQPPQMRFAPTFPTNGVTRLPPTFQSYNAIPHFQTQPLYNSVVGPSSGSSIPLQGGLTPSPIPLRKEMQKGSLKSKPRKKHVTRNAPQTVKGELLIIKTKRVRGPNKRPPGTAFSNLLDAIPTNVKEALEKDYKGCCESINVKDASTKQKHMFSNRHCKNLPLEYQEHIPNFVCPAFVAFKSNCRSKAGRYDSTDRHCKNCAGFYQVNKGNNAAFPVVITRAQYNSILNYRIARAEREGQKHWQNPDQATKQADGEILMVLAEIFKDGLPVWFPLADLGREPNDSAALAVPDATAQIPTNTTPVPVVVPVENHIELSLPVQEPSLFDPETASECVEALFGDGFQASSQESEASVAQPSTSTQVPVTQSDFYQPPIFDLENVDEWGPFLSSFS